MIMMTYQEYLRFFTRPEGHIVLVCFVFFVLLLTMEWWLETRLKARELLRALKKLK